MYHYQECGLRNIWLKNGYKTIKTAYGPALAIEDVGGLHRAIALSICGKSNRLSGPEVRFLRHELDMSQSVLAAALHVSTQTVALWEKSKAKISGPADKLLRVIVLGHFDGNMRVRRLIEVLKQHDHESSRGKLIFHEQQDVWQQAA